MIQKCLCVKRVCDSDGASAEAQGGKPYFGFKGNSVYTSYKKQIFMYMKMYTKVSNRSRVVLC